MKKIIVNQDEEGIRLFKYLKKIFKNMPDSLLQKLIRKNYFEINGKKIDSKYVLKSNDEINIYLSDETYNKYINNLNVENKKQNHKSDNYKEYIERIIYEDKNIILFNKPIGLLSQGDKSSDASVNSILNQYLKVNESTYKPSVVNRLDRNTEGIIIFAKTYIAAREISDMIKNNIISKEYYLEVNGILDKKSGTLTNLYRKNENTNKSEIRDFNGKIIGGYSVVKLEYKVKKIKQHTTEVFVNLITGKSHQIRAQFSYIGHPLIGDKKYMDISLYKKNVEEFGIRSQKLICYKIRFGKFENKSLENLSNKTFKIDI